MCTYTNEGSDMEGLWASNTGRCTCTAHAGNYLAEKIKSYSDVYNVAPSFVATPLDSWEWFSDEDLDDLRCDECALSSDDPKIIIVDGFARINHYPAA